MRERQNGTSCPERALFTGALAGYTANILLGTGVASHRVDTSQMRWIHHGLYIATVTLSAAAASSVFWGRSGAAWLILPAAVPFALIPRFSATSVQHVVVALAAAPFVGAAAARSWIEA